LGEEIFFGGKGSFRGGDIEVFLEGVKFWKEKSRVQSPGSRVQGPQSKVQGPVQLLGYAIFHKSKENNIHHNQLQPSFSPLLTGIQLSSFAVLLHFVLSFK